MAPRIPLWGQSAREDFERELAAFIAANGGANGIVARMHAAGLARVASSWAIPGAKEPITGDRLHQLFGTGVLRAFAAKLDLQPRELVRKLAQELPHALEVALAAQ